MTEPSYPFKWLDDMPKNFGVSCPAARATQGENTVTETESIYKILDDSARDWWYHRQLREQGKHQEARRHERRAILDNVRVLRECLENGGYAMNSRHGWRVQYREFASLSHCYPGLDRPMMRCCLKLGIPVCDTTTVPESAVIEMIRLPMASLDPDPVPENGYGSMSFAPVSYVFRLYRELGATIYNLEV